MRCFIHIYDEAIAVCKKCGKAMCANCSAYSNHIGICPECRREEFILECNRLNAAIQANRSSMVANIVFAVLFAVLAIVLAIFFLPGLAFLIGTLVCGIRAGVLSRNRRSLVERRFYIVNEINKLAAALQKGAKVI